MGYECWWCGKGLTKNELSNEIPHTQDGVIIVMCDDCIKRAVWEYCNLVERDV